VEKNTETGAEKRSAWICGRFSPGTATSMETTRLQILGVAGAGLAGQSRHRTELVAALVILAVGKQCAKPARAASRCSGIFTARQDIRTSKKISLLFGLFQYQSDRRKRTNSACFTSPCSEDARTEK
jgi:hypothetical protein